MNNFVKLILNMRNFYSHTNIFVNNFFKLVSKDILREEEYNIILRSIVNFYIAFTSDTKQLIYACKSSSYTSYICGNRITILHNNIPITPTVLYSC